MPQCPYLIFTFALLRRVPKCANVPYIIDGKLIAGHTYKLTEITPPSRHVTAESITFTVEDTGEIQEIVMKDDTTKVSILKVDDNENVVEGATLQLWDEDQIIEEWVTEKQPKEFVGILTVGKAYTVKETNVPDTYVTAQEKTFVVNDTNEVQEITITNNFTKVQISKQDIITEQEIQGAMLVLETIDGTQIDKWITTEKPHQINGTLVVGEVYKLIELTVPDGYIKAENVLFKVEDTEEVQKIVMKDDYTKVKIEKVDEKGKYISGAELQIVDKAGNVVEKWKTKKEAYEINKKLKAGETYTLQEITAPSGYEKIKDITFTVSEDGSQDTIRATDKKIKSILPKTGDWMILYVSIMLIAVGGIAFAIVQKKKKNK